MTENIGQLTAIAHHTGPMLVLAGPGSGKTHVITNRIGHLIDTHKVKPEEILVITFTKYAASEMKERFFRNYKTSVPVTFGTFHGVFYGILKWAYGISGNNILTDKEKNGIIMEILASDNIEMDFDMEMDDEKEFIQNIIKEISMVKGEGISIDEYEAVDVPPNSFRTIFKMYEEARKRLRKIDFDDMICQCYELLKRDEKICKMWQDKFKYILIDEFQDINQMQFDTIKLLALPENNLFIVGDDDQSIYRFRGAKPEIMLKFKEVFPTTQEVILEVNYRSTQAIVNGAGKVINKNEERFKKKISTINDLGEDIHVQEIMDANQEAEYVLEEMQKLLKSGVEPKEIGVIYRTNQDVGFLAGKMVEFNVPFQMKEKIPNLFDHFISKNILSYMHLAIGDLKRQYFLDIMNRPNRFVSRSILESHKEINFANLAASYKDKEWMEDRIHQLELDLRIMKNMTPFAFIEYLRKKVGYDAYLCEYADYKGLKVEVLRETLEEIQEQAKNHKTIDEWIAYVTNYGEQLKESISSNVENKHAIQFHTMHGSKGLEFDHVYIIGSNEGVTPSSKASLPVEIEEERRMFYVAMTRARKKLTITYVKQKHGKAVQPSRFVNELLL